MSQQATATVTIRNTLGLHARPATLLADAAAGYKCSVTIARGEECVDAKSIMHIMMLAATRGTDLIVSATGDDAEACVAAIVELVERGFDEE
ncbi:MAG: hypothetical protein CMJ31_06795 [Phycisphaerae bacterium]|nr:hypothetical protein [Phycisphaerae bacterium]